MHSQARKGSGTLTWVGDDGYVITAPVSSFSVTVGDDYSAVQTDYLLDSQFIYKTSQSVIFEAELKPGENYTIKDIGKDIEKTLAVKGNMLSERSALGVPLHAKGTYDSISDTTNFSWTDRLVMQESTPESCAYCNPDDEEDDYFDYRPI